MALPTDDISVGISEKPSHGQSRYHAGRFFERSTGTNFRRRSERFQPTLRRGLEFFNNADRQRRMEESETHHDRAPMAGVVRELESLPGINKFLGTVQAQRNQRLRQAIGVLVRMIMERRGWRKTGKKGSLGVRSAATRGKPNHNTGGLAFWFLRAERYEPEQGVKYPSVRKRCRDLEATTPKPAAHAKLHLGNGRAAKVPTQAAVRTPNPTGENNGLPFGYGCDHQTTSSSCVLTESRTPTG